MTAHRLVNLTPHRLRVIDEDGETLLDLPAALSPARIEQEIVKERHLGTVPLHTIRYGPPASLPPPHPGTLLVVSRVVAQQINRPDLIFPDGEIRDDHNRIIACRSLATFERR